MPLPSVILTLAFWVIGILLMSRIPSLSSAEERPEPSDEEPQTRISVVIPARNEAQRIAPLLASLRLQSLPSHEIIVVDDHSTDSTAAVAHQHGARVIASQALPETWTGKTWACWQGAKVATGELLLFLDADTWLEPHAVKQLVGAWGRAGGLVTVQPYHVTVKPYEQLSAFFNIVSMAGLNAFTPLGASLRPGGAFGACMACSRRDYHTIGGHAAVKAAVLEDLLVARLFFRRGLPVTCYGGKGAISFRMYPAGLGALVEGWSKSFASGAMAIRPFALVLTLGWVMGCFSTTSRLLQSLGEPLIPSLAASLAIYFLYALQILWILRRIGKFKWYTCLLFPVPLVFFALVSLHSLVAIHVLRRVTWRGRTIET